jgi:hypothetical protein
MIKNFTPEENYSFDVQKLADDFAKIEATHPGKTTYWLTTLSKEATNDMTALYDTSYIKNLYPKELFKDAERLSKANNANLSVDNFHSFMTGSYTHSIVLQIESDLRKAGKRITGVSYHKLYVARCYPLHTDRMEQRFHIPIITNANVFFMVEEELGNENYEIWRMPDAGKVYVFTPTAMHTAINAGYDDRVHLLIDYIDLE